MEQASGAGNSFASEAGILRAMEQGDVKTRREKWLDGLLFLLFCLDVSAVMLAVAFAPRLDNFSWDSGNPLSHWWNSRDRAAVPGVLFASIILSVGIHFFARTCLVLRDERQAELTAVRTGVNPVPPTD